MDNLNLHFRGQMEDESIIKFSRKHWITILPDLIPFVVFIAVILVLAFNIGQFSMPSITEGFFQLILILGTIIGLIAIHRFFLHIFTYFMSVTIITNRRIVELRKTLFLEDSKESMDIAQIQDIQLQQSGLIRTIMKFGNLHVTLGSSEVRTIHLLPNADYFFRLINKIKSELNQASHVDTTRKQQDLKSGSKRVELDFPYIIQTGSGPAKKE